MNEQKQEGALAEGARRANGAKAPGHRSERGRVSCQRKREAVLRLLRGESLETLCRELGTTAARLSAWREAFLRGGEAALKVRPADERDERERPAPRPRWANSRWRARSCGRRSTAWRPAAL